MIIRGKILMFYFYRNIQQNYGKETKNSGVRGQSARTRLQ